MSLIGKEVQPFKASAFNAGMVNLSKLQKKTLKVNGVLFASIQQTLHSFAQLNLKIFKTNMQH